ncbi:hypothetical protein D3C79_971000 [compost metagenome]
MEELAGADAGQQRGIQTAVDQIFIGLLLALIGHHVDAGRAPQGGGVSLLAGTLLHANRLAFQRSRGGLQNAAFTGHQAGRGVGNLV